MLGYGSDPAYTEFSPNGTVLHDVTFGPFHRNRASADNYRMLKVNWTADPIYAPKIAAGPAFWDGKSMASSLAAMHALEMATGNSSVFVSWNGATEVEEWVVLASNSTKNLNVTLHYWGRQEKKGFETKVDVGAEVRFVRAMAVGEEGVVLGVTPVLDLNGGNRTEVKFKLWAATEEWRSMNRGTLERVVDGVVTRVGGKRVAVLVVGVLCSLSGVLLIGLGIWMLVRCRRRGHRSGRGAYRCADGFEEVEWREERGKVSDYAVYTVGGDDDNEYGEGYRDGEEDYELDDATRVNSSDDDKSAHKYSFSEDEGDLSCSVAGSGSTSREGRRDSE